VLIVAGLWSWGAAPMPALDRSPDQSDVQAMVEAYKKDPLGPYQTLRWFCADGSILLPQERCAGPGGIQHAVPKDAVRTLASRRHIFLGQILAGTPNAEFLDEANGFSRAKQYELERYLRAVDDGWIMRRGYTFRGAVQAEDEEAWSRQFLEWLVARDDLLASRFFFVRQLARDLPRSDSSERASLIRGLAAAIAEEVPAFMPLRLKIHGQPEPSDLEAVRAFRKARKDGLRPEVAQKLEQLENEMATAYAAASLERFVRYAGRYRPDRPVGQGLRAVLSDREPAKAAAALCDLLWTIRQEVASGRHPPATRVSLLHLSNEAEAVLLTLIGRWATPTLRAGLVKADALARAAAGSGALEVWEWQATAPCLGARPAESTLTVGELGRRSQRVLSVVQWGTGMVHANYGDVADLFARFEPKARGFDDDRIRSGILLPLGEVAARLRQASGAMSGVANRVVGSTSPGAFRGLNPGAAVGELVVVSGSPEGLDLRADKIYVLSYPPSDLKPVAGILTVSEGNAVSHVQLLARNLGLPNAVLTEECLRELVPWSGREVFYAVSPGGAVILKRAEDATADERALVEGQGTEAGDERVTVPVDQLRLDTRELLDLRDLRSADSGRLTGPKAANLGELRHLFPDKVAPGLVLPFGVFRAHLEQPRAGSAGTYWDLVQATFQDMPTGDEGALRARLAELYEAIRRIPFLPGFEESLQRRFRETLGAEPEQLAVFVRSDTNMEDLKDFTGAGLNLTVPNVLGEPSLLQAIREVWASPFTERSYEWRRRVLTNPADVYPSVLLLPTQRVEKSGVMMTTGITSANPADTTVAFNWGQGGAVDSQAAESYLLREDGTDELLSPAREREYNLLLPRGGVELRAVDFSRPILSADDRRWLRAISADLRRLLPGVLSHGFPGPFDMELGFVEGAPRLLQVRPFVQNHRAWSSPYLRALDEGVPRETPVSLDQEMPNP
jgi:hypothetical protein